MPRPSGLNDSYSVLAQKPPYPVEFSVKKKGKKEEKKKRERNVAHNPVPAMTYIIKRTREQVESLKQKNIKVTAAFPK